MKSLWILLVCQFLSCDGTSISSSGELSDLGRLDFSRSDLGNKDSSPDIVPEKDLFTDRDVEIDSEMDEGSSSKNSPLLAFPEAKGFGAKSIGGRGGKVIFVTNLNDSGKGSLRAACESEGARIVIFRVGGTITIESDIQIKNPFITIAGHSAPGEGIMVKGNGARSLSLFHVSTHDVIFRHLRLRRGPSTNGGECTSDTIALIDADKVVVDHISASWTTDQLLTMWPATNTTIQNSTFFEALNRSTHSDNCKADGPLEPHALGPIVGSNSNNVSFFENIFANNVGRNPFIASKGGDFEVINNLVYNVCYAMGLSGRDENKRSQVNYIGNFIKWGPKSCDGHRNNIYFSGNAKGFLLDNLTPLRNAEDPEWMASSEFQVQTPADIKFKQDKKFDFPIKTAMPAQDVYDALPTRSGSRLVSNKVGDFVEFIDVVDERNYADLKSGTKTEGTKGRRLDHPDDVGGWPKVANATPYPDFDEDGMPDAWEERFGLDKNVANSAEDPDEDGYTNIEEYLNQTRPK